MKQFYCAIMLALLPTTTGAFAQQIDTRRYIYVEAQASVEAKADTVKISLSVSDKAPTSEGAISQTADRSRQVVQTLFGFGLTIDDIETTSFRFEPVYIIATDSDGKPVSSYPDPDRDTFDGYRATNNIDIEIHDFGKAGELLSSAATLGIEFDRVNFSATREDEFRLQADAKAAESAVTKARLYANALGLQLGALLAAREGVGYNADTMEYPPDNEDSAADLGILAGTPVPLAPPTLSFYGSISTKWEVMPTSD